jgi:hypothetical protein
VLTYFPYEEPQNRDANLPTTDSLTPLKPPASSPPSKAPTISESQFTPVPSNSFYTKVSVSIDRPDTIPPPPSPPCTSPSTRPNIVPKPDTDDSATPHLAKSRKKRTPKAPEGELPQDELPNNRAKAGRKRKTSEREVNKGGVPKTSAKRKKEVSSKSDDDGESDLDTIIVVPWKAASSKMKGKKPNDLPDAHLSTPPAKPWPPLRCDKPWRGFQDELFEAASFVLSITSSGKLKAEKEALHGWHEQLELFFVRFSERLDFEGKSRQKGDWFIEAGSSLSEHCEYRAVSHTRICYLCAC